MMRFLVPCWAVLHALILPRVGCMWQVAVNRAAGVRRYGLQQPTPTHDVIDCADLPRQIF